MSTRNGWRERLAELAELEAGWYGPCSLPLHPAVVAEAEQLMAELFMTDEAYNTSRWFFCPTGDGELSFEVIDQESGSWATFDLIADDDSTLLMWYMKEDTFTGVTACSDENDPEPYDRDVALRFLRTLEMSGENK
jgi:hypothetical protein